MIIHWCDTDMQISNCFMLKRQPFCKETQMFKQNRQDDAVAYT